MKRILLSASLFALSATVHAVDGVILIDQAKALAGGVTPGDAPGFPVTLSKAGSYKLAGNLTMPNYNTSAIEATVPGVSLDLNGFTIDGANFCPASVSQEGSDIPDKLCSNASISFGVKLQKDSSVRNGRIIGFGAETVNLAHASIAENLQLSWAKFGIFSTGSSEIRNNIIENMKTGVQTYEPKDTYGATIGIGATIRNNTITSSEIGNVGITGFGGRVVGNTLYGRIGLTCTNGEFYYQDNLIKVWVGGQAIQDAYKCVDGGGNQTD